MNTYNQQMHENTRRMLDFQGDKKRETDRKETIESKMADKQLAHDKEENRLNQVKDTKEDYLKKIEHLGSLPAEAYEKYKSANKEQLLGQIELNSHELNQFSHVNKKAAEQHSRFQEKHQNLVKRIQELDESDNSIQELLEHLEKVKYEAIVRTFRLVAQHFSEIFRELVPNGKGKLKMVKGDSNLEGLDKYSGVSIDVAFHGDETPQKMQQLSGGQKTAVALTLIFAIQRADPAPFYLFDELDAALDSQYRTAVANLIARSADRAQFIITTFKQELCHKASKMYEVRFVNKASTIKQIDRNRALEIIQTFSNEAPNAN